MPTIPEELSGASRIALVQPNFPWPSKSKNSHQSIPFGLLKIASWLKSMDMDVRLFQNGEVPGENWDPDEVWITTLFTYWSEYVERAYSVYRMLYPEAHFRVGGILTTLAPEFCQELFGAATVYEGLLKEAEGFPADYSFLDKTLDLQIMVASRGCIRRCKFCYAWVLEGNIRSIPIDFVVRNIRKPRVVFYDNNFLANPDIDELLERLSRVKIKYFDDGNPRIIRPRYECQSGFDGRLLQKRPELAMKLKKAGFRFPRIAWDGSLDDKDDIRRQLDILEEAGFRNGETQLFMLFNHDLGPEELDAKRRVCWDWQVQIIDCRFRPLTQFEDNFSTRISQTEKDYHIHSEAGWTDQKIKDFRRTVRQQNICVRYNFPWYHKSWERKKLRKQLPAGVLTELKHEPPHVVRSSAWFPDAVFPSEPLYDLKPEVVEEEAMIQHNILRI